MTTPVQELISTLTEHTALLNALTDLHKAQYELKSWTPAEPEPEPPVKPPAEKLKPSRNLTETKVKDLSRMELEDIVTDLILTLRWGKVGYVNVSDQALYGITPVWMSLTPLEIKEGEIH